MRTVVPPFLKWAGGKRWFVQTYAQLLPKKFNRYIEPFLGGASVFFHLQPKVAILGDVNPDLIAAYIAVKEHPGALWKAFVIFPTTLPNVCDQLGIALNHHEALSDAEACA